MKRRHTIDANARLNLAGRRIASKGVVTAEEINALEAAEKIAAVPKPSQEKNKDKDHTDAIACQLALKYRLMFSEVKGIIKEFVKARRNEEGGLGRDEFDRVMACIFDVPAINQNVSHGAYVETEMDKEVNIDNFLTWYVQNMFTSVNALTCDQAMARGNAVAYNVAVKYKVSNFAVDKIKCKFDHYDLDKSGKIDYSEFEAMFCSILKASSASDLNPDRIKRFWSQADKNGDGGIDFEEFVDWYLRYFSPDNENDDWDMSGPIRKYYDSYNPVVQRRNHFEARAQSLDDNHYH